MLLMFGRDAQIRTEKSSFGDCCDAISPRPYTTTIILITLLLINSVDRKVDYLSFSTSL